MSYKVRKARKRPLEIEAVQFFDDPETLEALGEFITDQPITVDYADPSRPQLKLKTLEDRADSFHYADEGDWIIKGVNGEFYACKPDVFQKTYDLL